MACSARLTLSMHRRRVCRSRALTHRRNDVHSSSGFRAGTRAASGSPLIARARTPVTTAPLPPSHRLPSIRTSVRWFVCAGRDARVACGGGWVGSSLARCWGLAASQVGSVQLKSKGDGNRASQTWRETRTRAPTEEGATHRHTPAHAHQHTSAGRGAVQEDEHLQQRCGWHEVRWTGQPCRGAQLQCRRWTDSVRDSGTVE